MDADRKMLGMKIEWGMKVEWEMSVEQGKEALWEMLVRWVMENVRVVGVHREFVHRFCRCTVRHHQQKNALKETPNLMRHTVDFAPYLGS